MRFRYAVAAIFLFAIEVLIALYVRDEFIRPYVGDMLAVALVYAALRAVTPMRLFPALVATLGIAFGIEFAQLFGAFTALGFADNQIARIVLGGVFDLKDLMAYSVAALLIAAVEMGLGRWR
ncbi:MAG: DUF2809 domain-containing protein [Hyphomonadaceae bacterium]